MITKEELRVRLETKRARIMERIPFVAGEISLAEEVTKLMDEGLKKLAIQKDRLERKLIDLGKFDGEVDGLPVVETLQQTEHLDYILRYCEPKDKPHAGIIVDKAAGSMDEDIDKDPDYDYDYTPANNKPDDPVSEIGNGCGCVLTDGELDDFD